MKKHILMLVLFLMIISLTSAMATQLTILTWAHFVPASDQYLQQIAQKFGKLYNVDVRIDFVSLNNIDAKLAAEFQSQSGDDIVLLMNHSTALYSSQLANVSDVASAIENEYGSFWSVASESSKINGQWLSIPLYYTPAPAILRTDYFSTVGATYPNTWDELLQVAKQLYKIGHPIGLPISNCGDSNDWLIQLMASFGAYPVNSKGEVTIDSTQTKEAIDYVRALYKYMSPQVLGWDGAGNNNWLLSGVGSYIINPISVIVSANQLGTSLPQNLTMELPPAGPEGRYVTTSIYTFGIPKWSQNVNLAKEFLLYLYKPENFIGWVNASGGYNMPLFTDMSRFENLPIWKQYPNYQVLFGFGKWMHMSFWPAPSSGKDQLAYNLYIIPNMFAHAVTGWTDEQAISWAKSQLETIYGK